MKQLIVLSVITILFLGCEISKGEDDKKSSSQQIVQNTVDQKGEEIHDEIEDVTNHLTIADMEFTLRATCANYLIPLDRSPNSWANVRSTQPNQLDHYIVSDDAIQIAKIESPDYFHFYGRNYVIKHKDTQKQQFIKDHIDDNILLSCKYKDNDGGIGQTYKMFVPLKVSKAWENTFTYNKTKRNNHFVMCSLLFF